MGIFVAGVEETFGAKHPQKRAGKRASWALQTKIKPMPEPTINDLQPQTGPELGKITVLNNSAPKRRQRKKGSPLFLQHDELERLFSAIDSPRDRAIFRLAYHAGLRASELGMLEMRDYDARTARIFIHRLKGSNSGEHHMSRETARVFRAWLKIRGTQPGPIFPTRSSDRIGRNMLDVLMKRYCAAAKIPRQLSHFHVLKHTCATHLLEKGVHVEQVQDWIGHANIQNTMIYGHMTNSRRQELAQQLREWK